MPLVICRGRKGYRSNGVAKLRYIVSVSVSGLRRFEVVIHYSDPTFYVRLPGGYLFWILGIIASLQKVKAMYWYQMYDKVK
jgi:hypothetical protein